MNEENKDLVRARCGKMVLPHKLAQHERLCSACGGKSPLDDVNARKEEAKAAELETQSREPEATAPVPSGEATPAEPGATSSPALSTSPEDKVVEKVLSVLSPALHDRFNEIAKAISANKSMSQEEVIALIDQRLKTVLAPLINQKEDEAITPASANGGGDGINSLVALVREFMHRPAQSSGFDPKMMEFLNKWTEMQVNLFRSGSDFTANVISTAAKLGANPGDAADLITRNKGGLMKNTMPVPPEASASA